MFFRDSRTRSLHNSHIGCLLATVLRAVNLPHHVLNVGENIKDEWNAIHAAETPTTDGLKTVKRRWRTIKAHGTAVGLPSDADMGNSEVCTKSCLFFHDQACRLQKVCGMQLINSISIQ